MKTQEMTLAERFSHTAPVFQYEIKAIAERAGLTWEQVYKLWRDYSHQCELYDQSALLSEFKVWYKAQLAGKAVQQ